MNKSCIIVVKLTVINERVKMIKLMNENNQELDKRNVLLPIVLQYLFRWTLSIEKHKQNSRL